MYMRYMKTLDPKIFCLNAACNIAVGDFSTPLH